MCNVIITVFVFNGRATGADYTVHIYSLVPLMC